MQDTTQLSFDTLSTCFDKEYLLPLVFSFFNWEDPVINPPDLINELASLPLLTCLDNENLTYLKYIN